MTRGRKCNRCVEWFADAPDQGSQPWYCDGCRGRTHGIRATYVHGCRCPQCTEAERLYKRDLRRRHAEAK